MIVGKNSWKGFLLLFYVVITICAIIGCFIAQHSFFYAIALALALGNGCVTWRVYKKLNNKQNN